MATLPTYIPLSDILTWWPEHLFGNPGLDRIAITGHSLAQAADRVTAHLDLVIGQDLEIPIAGLEGFILVLPTTDLNIEAEYAGSFELRAGGFGAGLRIINPVLIPVDGTYPDWTPRLDQVGTPEPLELTLDVGQLVVDADFNPYLDVTNELSLSPFMIGESGIVVEVTGLRLHLSGKELPPAGQAEGFRGLSVEQVKLYLPEDFDVPGVVPDAFRVQGLVIGHGGVSGSFSGEWQTGWDGMTPEGNGAGALLGMPIALESVNVALNQNALSSTAFAGELGLPYFDAIVGIDVTLAADGTLSIALSQTDEDGLLTLDIPHLGTLTLASIGFSTDEAPTLLLSGTLQLDVLDLNWPGIELQNLRIGPDGSVQLPDGWLDLPEPVGLDFFGFGFEISRIGFGNTDDDRRWVGLSGGVNLLPMLPTGASVEGLRIIWDPTGARDVELTLEGVGIGLTLPNVLQLTGDVTFINEPDDRYFEGNARLEIIPIGLHLDASLKVGHDIDDGYKYLYSFMGLTLPIGIPIWATGTAIYGISGLYGMNVAPTTENSNWYGWYAKQSPAFDITHTGKWRGEEDGTAFGAGMTLGTLFDLGRVVSTKALFALVLPGPVIILNGKANLLELPPDVNDASSEGVFNMLAVLDALAGNIQLNIDAAWGKPNLLDIAASAEAYFDFANPKNWHVYLGQDQPGDRRIRANMLSLFNADAYLMISQTGIATGASISWGYDWKFGPARVVLKAWIGGDAVIAWQPPQLEGILFVGGEFDVSVAGFGIGIGAEARLSGKAPTLYWVRGELELRVKLPTPFKDLKEEILLEWKEEKTPPIEEVQTMIGLEHLKVDETWTDLPTSFDKESLPTVPLDARVSIAFDRSMHDVTGLNFDSVAPYMGGTKVGDYTFEYELQDVVLEKWSKAGGIGWAPVDDLYGTWMAVEDAEGNPASTRLQLWSRSPFAFTRQTSRTYRDAFLANHAMWPCYPAIEPETHCSDWENVNDSETYPHSFEREGLVFTFIGADQIFATQHTIEACGTRYALAPDDGNLNTLWVLFPEPVRNVTVCFEGTVLAAVAYAHGQLEENITFPKPTDITFVAEGIDTIALVGFDNAYIARICYQIEAEAAAYDAVIEHSDRVEAALLSWSSEDEIFEPDTWYRLTIQKETIRTKIGDTDSSSYTDYSYFQTAAPPGLTQDDPPAIELGTNTILPYPFGGKLQDLREYIERSVPADGAQPVYRAYDLGADFNENYVEQMYGADMEIRLLDGNGQPAIGPDGQPLVFPNQWAAQPVASLTETEYPYTTRVEECLSVPSVGYPPNHKITFANGVLLDEDFSGDLDQWSDPNDDTASAWTIASNKLVFDGTVVSLLGALLIAGDPAWDDYAIEVDLTEEGDDVGLACRYKDGNDGEVYYRLRLNSAGRSLTRLNDGTGTVLWEDNEPYTAGSAATLCLQCVGARIRGQLGETLLFDLVDAEGPATGQVGIFANVTASFARFLVRDWPGASLGAQTCYAAELIASYPRFSGGLTAGWLDSGTAWTELTKTNARLAAIGLEEWTDYRVEVGIEVTGKQTGVLVRFTQDEAAGTFSCYRLLINSEDEILRFARLTGTYNGSSYELDNSGKTELWRCVGNCDVDFTLSLHDVIVTCEGHTFTIEVDGIELAQIKDSALSKGKAGLYFVGADDPAFSELVIRSAPRRPVHAWHFVTSRYAGLVEHLDSFAGTIYLEQPDTLDAQALADAVTAAQTSMAAAKAGVDSSRTALASTSPDELIVQSQAARDAVSAWYAESVAHFDALHGILLGGLYRPLPPVVELSCIVHDAKRHALLLESPEPLDWSRIDLQLLRHNNGSYQPFGDVLVTWNIDGARAWLINTDGTRLPDGDYRLEMKYRLDIGPEAPLLRRSGSVLPEVGWLVFTLA